MSLRWTGWKRTVAAVIYALAAAYTYRLGELTRSSRKDVLLIAADIAFVLFLLFYQVPRRHQKAG